MGITLISCGASVLNQVIERKTDAKMGRTAQRPVAAGRFGLPHGLALGLACFAAGAVVLAWYTNPVTVMLTLLTGFMLRRGLHPAQALHHAGYFYRRVSRRHAPAAGLDRRPRRDRVAGRGPVCHSFRLAVSPFHGHRVAVPRRLCQGRDPHAAGGAAGWLVHGLRSAHLCGADDPGQRRAVFICT